MVLVVEFIGVGGGGSGRNGGGDEGGVGSGSGGDGDGDGGRDDSGHRGRGGDVGSRRWKNQRRQTERRGITTLDIPKRM